MIAAYHPSLLQKQKWYINVAYARKNLLFLFPQWIPGHSGEAGCSSKVTFSNWATYKNKIKQAAKDYKASNPVAHYWEGEVTPLVHPSDATSYGETIHFFLKI